MSDDKELRAWVSDNLFALLGLSESALVAYICSLGAPTADQQAPSESQCRRLNAWPPFTPSAHARAAARQEGDQCRQLGVAAGSAGSQPPLVAASLPHCALLMPAAAFGAGAARLAGNPDVCHRAARESAAQAG